MTDPHAFYATRKGTPKGETVPTWWKFCDECGDGREAPQHRVSQAEEDNALLRAIEEEP